MFTLLKSKILSKSSFCNYCRRTFKLMGQNKQGKPIVTNCLHFNVLIFLEHQT